MRMRKYYPVVVLLILLAAIALSVSLVTTNANALPTFTTAVGGIGPCDSCHTITATHAIVNHTTLACGSCHLSGTATPPTPVACAACHGGTSDALRAMAARRISSTTTGYFLILILPLLFPPLPGWEGSVSLPLIVDLLWGLLPTAAHGLLRRTARIGGRQTRPPRRADLAPPDTCRQRAQLSHWCCAVSIVRQGALPLYSDGASGPSPQRLLRASSPAPLRRQRSMPSKKNSGSPTP